MNYEPRENMAENTHSRKPIYENMWKYIMGECAALRIRSVRLSIPRLKGRAQNNLCGHLLCVCALRAKGREERGDSEKEGEGSEGYSLSLRVA